MTLVVGAESKEPFTRATKIARTDSGCPVSEGNIAAIDFGTTSVSLAYITGGDKLEHGANTLMLDSDTKSARVANAILLRDNDQSLEVVAIGGTAQTSYMRMRQENYSKHIYFERIKMLMKRDQTINRQTIVKSFSGRKFYLVEVIAFILKVLKVTLIDHLSRGTKPLKTTDFDWVITVPAIWDARGKRMMREAAYLAGLLTNESGITQFTPVSCHKLPHPIEKNPDKLCLALEPEAAAIYSQKMTSQEVVDAKSVSLIPPKTRYMVLDIGGGTVDVTAHVEVLGGVKVISIPTGNSWGGTKVNEQFSIILQDIVGDKGFSSFITTGDYSQQLAILNKLLFKEFEDQKVLFGEGKAIEMAIGLPNKFISFYKEAKIEEAVKKLQGIDFDNDTLYIEKEVVENKLFGPALKGIVDITLEALNDIEYQIDTIYLVGGFGGCKYVYEKIKQPITELYSSKKLQCEIIIPTSPSLAVAQGAVLWRKHPEVIKARRADATYGIAVSLPFDESKHDQQYRFYIKEHDEYRCNKIFCVFLQKGEIANANEIFTMDMMPIDDSTTMTITLYSTPRLGVQYTADTLVTKIGELVIDIPNPNKLSREQRCVDISMDFSGTEIQAKAKYCVTGKEVKTVCDFLSAQQ